MRQRRSDGKPQSGHDGRVKAASRASGSAEALALTRPARPDNNPIIRSPLILKTVAEEARRAVSKGERKVARGSIASGAVRKANAMEAGDWRGGTRPILRDAGFACSSG